MTNKFTKVILGLITLALLAVTTIPLTTVSADTQMLDVVKKIADKKDGNIENIGDGWDLFTPDEDNDSAVLTKSTEGIFTASYDALDNTVWSGDGTDTLENSARYALTLRELGLDYSFAGGANLMLVMGRWIFGCILILIIYIMAGLNTLAQFVMKLTVSISPLTWLKTAVQWAIDGNKGSDGSITGDGGGAFHGIISFLADILYWISKVSTAWWFFVLLIACAGILTGFSRSGYNGVMDSKGRQLFNEIFKFFKRIFSLLLAPLLLLTAAGEIAQDIVLNADSTGFVSNTVGDVYGNWFAFKRWAQYNNLAIPSGMTLKNYGQALDKDTVIKLNGDSSGANLKRVADFQNNGIGTSLTPWQMASQSTDFLFRMWIRGDKYGGNAYESYIKKLIRSKNSDKDDAKKNPIGYISSDGGNPYDSKYTDFIKSVNKTANLTYTEESNSKSDGSGTSKGYYSSDGKSGLSVYGMFNYLNIRADSNSIFYSNNSIFQGDANVSYHQNVTYVPGISWYGVATYLFIIVKAIMITIVSMAMLIQIVTAIAKAFVDFTAAVTTSLFDSVRWLMNLFSAVLSLLMKLVVLSGLFTIVPTFIDSIITSIDNAFSENVLSEGVITTLQSSNILPIGAIDNTWLGIARFLETILIVVLLLSLLKIGPALLSLLKAFIQMINDRINKSQGQPNGLDSLKNGMGEMKDHMDRNKGNKDGKDGDGKNGDGKNGKDGKDPNDLENKERGTVKDAVKDMLAKPVDTAKDFAANAVEHGKDAIDRVKDAANFVTGHGDKQMQTRTPEQLQRDIEDRKARYKNAVENMKSENKDKQTTADFDNMSEESKEIAETREQQALDTSAEDLSTKVASPQAIQEALDQQEAVEQANLAAQDQEFESQDKEMTTRIVENLEHIVNDLGEGEGASAEAIQNETKEMTAQIAEANAATQNAAKAVAATSDAYNDMASDVAQATKNEQAVNDGLNDQIKETSANIDKMKAAGAAPEAIQQQTNQLQALQMQKKASDSRLGTLQETGNQVQALQQASQAVANTAQTAATATQKQQAAVNAYANNATMANLKQAVGSTSTAKASLSEAKANVTQHAQTAQAIQSQLAATKQATQSAQTAVTTSRQMNTAIASQGATAVQSQQYANAQKAFTAASVSANSATANVTRAATQTNQAVARTIERSNKFKANVATTAAQYAAQSHNGAISSHTERKQMRQVHAAQQQQASAQIAQRYEQRRALLNSDNANIRETARQNVAQELSHATYDQAPASGRYVNTPKGGKRLTNGEFRQALEKYQRVISQPYSSESARTDAIRASKKQLVSQGISPALVSSSKAVQRALGDVTQKREAFTSNVTSRISKNDSRDWVTPLTERTERQGADYSADNNVSKHSLDDANVVGQHEDISDIPPQYLDVNNHDYETRQSSATSRD